MKEATTAKINKTLCPVLSITSAFLFILYNIIENSIKWSLKNWRVHSFPAVIVEPNSMKTDSSLLARTQTKKKPYTLRLLQPSLLFFFFKCSLPHFFSVKPISFPCWAGISDVSPCLPIPRLCWSSINPFLLEKHLAVYLFQVSVLFWGFSSCPILSPGQLFFDRSFA